MSAPFAHSLPQVCGQTRLSSLKLSAKSIEKSAKLLEELEWGPWGYQQAFRHHVPSLTPPENGCFLEGKVIIILSLIFFKTYDNQPNGPLQTLRNFHKREVLKS